MSLDAHPALFVPAPSGFVAARRGAGVVQAYAGMRLLPMQLFNDIAVVPAEPTLRAAGIPTGGPIWPDFEGQTLARHCRNGKPADVRPASRPLALLRPLRGPTVWGGIARNHFGHFVGEFSTRLLQSVAERPDDRFLFLTDPTTPDAAPGFFWSLLAWYGIAREQTAFVEHPTTVRQLRVAAQGEQLPMLGPSAAYLDLVERNAGLRGLAPVANELLYVGRPGLCSKGQGSHVGEDYLMACLRSLGVAVLDPGAHDLRAQLALYAGAHTIVFAEGSAIHGRQLLGRIPGQRIVVLVRRPGERVGRASLAPRCGELQYVEVTRALGFPVRFAAGPHMPVAVSFYDVPLLMRVFRDMGVPLASGWDRAAYEAQRDRDVLDWMRVRLAPGQNVAPGPTLKHLRELFAAEGLSHLPIPIDEGGGAPAASEA